MKTLFRTSSVCLALLLTPFASTYAEGPSGPVVKLIGAGSPPRGQLRLSPKAGQADGLTMTMKMSTAMSMAGRKSMEVKSPPIQMKLEMNVDSVDADGDIHYTARFTEAKVSSDDPQQAAMAGMINQSLAGMDAMTIAVVVSNQGHTRSAKTSGLEKLSPAMKQQMGSIVNQLEQMSVLLPEEAVGVGGSWEVTQQIVMNGLSIDQACVYEVTAISGSRLDLKFALKQTVPEQVMQNDALPPGTTVKVLKLASTGEGTATFDLTRLAPVVGRTRVHSLTSMEINANGVKQLMSTEMRMEMDMTGAK